MFCPNNSKMYLSPTIGAARCIFSGKHSHQFLRKLTLSVPRSFFGSNVEDARFCVKIGPICSLSFAYSATSFFEQLK